MADGRRKYHSDLKEYKVSFKLSEMDYRKLERDVKQSGVDRSKYLRALVQGAGGIDILNWCQVLSNGRKYTCPTKVVDGELFFAFKKGWHSVGKYISEHAEELVSEGGKTFLRPYK